MALFKNKGNKSNRANAIMDKYNLHGEEKTAEELEAERLAAEEGKTEEELEAERLAAEEASKGEGKTEEELEAERLAAEEASKGEEKTEEELEAERLAAKNKNKPVPQELTDDVVFSYLSEKLKREIKGYDDLTQKEIELDPEVSQLLEWKDKTGLSLSKWSDYNRDYSKMGDLEVARAILADKFPNFTPEEVNYKLQRFVYNEDSDEESDQIKKSIALKEFAQEGREEFEKKQLKLKTFEPSPTLTQEQNDELDFAKQARESVEQSIQSQKQYVEDLNKSALALNSLDLKLSEDLTIKYEVPEGDQKTLAKSIIEMPHWYNEDGSVNHDNIALDGLKVKNFDSIMNSVFEQGRAVGKEEVISGKPHSDVEPDLLPQGGDEDTKKGNIKEVISTITGRGRGKLKFGKVKE